MTIAEARRLLRSARRVLTDLPGHTGCSCYGVRDATGALTHYERCYTGRAGRLIERIEAGLATEDSEQLAALRLAEVSS